MIYEIFFIGIEKGEEMRRKNSRVIVRTGDIGIDKRITQYEDGYLEIYFNDGSAFPTCELLEKMSDLYNNDLLPQQDISSLKKRIKYCKNPMEKKMLQQELNALYKEQKRRK